MATAGIGKRAQPAGNRRVRETADSEGSEHRCGILTSPIPRRGMYQSGGNIEHRLKLT